METRYDRNRVPYTEETIDNFLEFDEYDISCGVRPDVTLSIRKYPLRYFLSFEIMWIDPEEEWPLSGEDARLTYVDSSYVRLWPEKYLHSEFDRCKTQILNSIRAKLQKHYLGKADFSLSTRAEWESDKEYLESLRKN